MHDAMFNQTCPNSKLKFGNYLINKEQVLNTMLYQISFLRTLVVAIGDAGTE